MIFKKIYPNEGFYPHFHAFHPDLHDFTSQNLDPGFYYGLTMAKLVPYFVPDFPPSVMSCVQWFFDFTSDNPHHETPKALYLAKLALIFVSGHFPGFYPPVHFHS